MKFLAAMVRWLHWTFGITTPRPEQERMVVAIWIISTLVIIAVAIGFLFLVIAAVQSAR